MPCESLDVCNACRQHLVICGFPSPTDDYMGGPLDLNELLGAHLASIFVVGSVGNSMIGAGIFDGDICLVNRSLTARDRA